MKLCRARENWPVMTLKAQGLLGGSRCLYLHSRLQMVYLLLDGGDDPLTRVPDISPFRASNQIHWGKTIV